jgi:hypothetical protein
VYFVDSADGRVIEADRAGTDTVYAKVDDTLAAGEEIEKLRADIGAMNVMLSSKEFRNELGAGDGRLCGGSGHRQAPSLRRQRSPQRWNVGRRSRAWTGWNFPPPGSAADWWPTSHRRL